MGAEKSSHGSSSPQKRVYSTWNCFEIGNESLMSALMMETEDSVGLSGS